MEKEILKGGAADGKTLKDIAKKHGVSLEHIRQQAEMGFKFEKEHTDNLKAQFEIIKDHLFEDPDAYTKISKTEKIEAKEQTMSDASGSFETNAFPITKREIYHGGDEEPKEMEMGEATDSSSSGAYDVSFSSGNKNPLAIGGPKSINTRRNTIQKKGFPLWGGPDSKFVGVKEKCKKFPYCDEGPGAIEYLSEAILDTSEKFGIPIKEIQKLILRENMGYLSDMKSASINTVIEEALTSEVKNRILSENDEQNIDPILSLSDKINGIKLDNGKIVLGVDEMDENELKNLIKNLHLKIGSCEIEVNGDQITISSAGALGEEEINENMKNTKATAPFTAAPKKSCTECNKSMEEQDITQEEEVVEEKEVCPKCGKEVCECGKKPVKESKKRTIRVTESKLIEMINKIVSESVPGLEVVKRAHTKTGNETKDHMTAVNKDLKDFMSTKDFPKQNTDGEAEDNMYRNSDEENDYITGYRGGGPQDLKYDNDPSAKFQERLKKALEGDTTMGNGQDDGEVNITPSDAGKVTFDAIDKKRKLREKEPMYKKDAQPIMNVNEDKVIQEEIKRMKEMSGYNKKTQ